MLKTFDFLLRTMRKLKLPGRDVSRPRLDENDVELIRRVVISGVTQPPRNIVE